MRQRTLCPEYRAIRSVSTPEGQATGVRFRDAPRVDDPDAVGPGSPKIIDSHAPTWAVWSGDAVGLESDRNVRKIGPVRPIGLCQVRRVRVDCDPVSAEGMGLLLPGGSRWVVWSDGEELGVALWPADVVHLIPEEVHCG